jgi:hypothetical protein
VSIFQIPATGLQEINVRLSGDTATTIVDASTAAGSVLFVPWFEVNEVGGGTQNLTVDIYDGTNAAYLSDDGGTAWVAKAVTANKGYKFSQGYLIPVGSKLRVTSSDSDGDFHVHGIVGKPF